MNNWPLENYPKIVPGQINTPSLKEVAVMLRAMGLDLTRDFSLNNYVRSLMSMPQISIDEFNEIYSDTMQNDSNIDPSFNNADDSSMKVFEQNETNRMTGEESY